VSAPAVDSPRPPPAANRDGIALHNACPAEIDPSFAESRLTIMRAHRGAEILVVLETSFEEVFARIPTQTADRLAWALWGRESCETDNGIGVERVASDDVRLVLEREDWGAVTCRLQDPAVVGNMFWQATQRTEREQAEEQAERDAAEAKRRAAADAAEEKRSAEQAASEAKRRAEVDAAEERRSAEQAASEAKPSSSLGTLIVKTLIEVLPAGRHHASTPLASTTRYNTARA